MLVIRKLTKRQINLPVNSGLTFWLIFDKIKKMHYCEWFAVIKGGISMITNYGKILRKIRIDCDELLKDMADKIGVSSAYLSAVENGNKSPSEKLTDSIIEKYNFDVETSEELRRTSVEDIYSTVVQLNLHGKSPVSKDLALSFARQFNSLSEMDINSIKNILSKGGNC